MSKMLEAARRVVQICMRVEKGQQLLVITDPFVMPRRIGEAIALAAEMEGAKVVTMVVPVPQHHGEEPLPMVQAAVTRADMLFLAGDKYLPLGHSSSHDEAFKRQLRVYATMSATESYFCRPLDAEQVRQIKEQTDRLSRLLSDAKRARVTSETGTNISVSLEGRTAGSFNPLDGVMVLDYAEAAIAPVEHTAEGVLVIDEVDGWGVPLERPMALEVKKGRVVEVGASDPKERARMQQLLATDANSNVICELALGSSHTVPTRLTGSRYDYGRLGCSHFAVGRNTALRGPIQSKIHVDFQLARPTVELDGATVVSNGELVI